MGNQYLINGIYPVISFTTNLEEKNSSSFLNVFGKKTDGISGHGTYRKPTHPDRMMSLIIIGSRNNVSTLYCIDPFMS